MSCDMAKKDMYHSMVIIWQKGLISPMNSYKLVVVCLEYWGKKNYEVDCCFKVIIDQRCVSFFKK